MINNRKADVAKNCLRDPLAEPSAEFSAILPTETSVMSSDKSSQSRIDIQRQLTAPYSKFDTNTSGTGQFSFSALLTMKAELPGAKKIISRDISGLPRGLLVSRPYLLVGVLLGSVFWLILSISSVLRPSSQSTIATDGRSKSTGKLLDGASKRPSVVQQHRQREQQARRSAALLSKQRSTQVRRGEPQSARAESTPARQKASPQQRRLGRVSQQRKQASVAEEQGDQKRATSQWLPPKSK